MDISRRDFGKWMGVFGIGAMSTSALDLALPSAVGAATITTPTSVDISMELSYDEWFEEKTPVESMTTYKASKWEITIKTKNQEMAFEADDILWCEDHDSSINESQVKIYRNALDLTLPVNVKGKRIVNSISKNHTYRIVANPVKLVSYKGKTSK